MLGASVMAATDQHKLSLSAQHKLSPNSSCLFEPGALLVVLFLPLIVVTVTLGKPVSVTKHIEFGS
jgi:hypothetical protein